MPGLKAWINDQKSDDDYNKYKKRYDLFEHNEKQLRQVKVEDIVVFMMSEYLLKYTNKNLIKTDGQFYLKDIAPKGEKGILDKPMANFGRVFNYEVKGINTVDIAIKGSTRIYQEDLKVKNLGDFNKFIKDRRLNNLLAYLQKDQIPRAELEKELENYDTVRIDIFKTIHDFENRILKQAPSIDGTDFDNIIAHYQQSANLPTDAAARIKKIRDAFSHNKYPDPVYFMGDGQITFSVNGFYAQYFLGYLKTNLNVV